MVVTGLDQPATTRLIRQPALELHSSYRSGSVGERLAGCYQKSMQITERLSF